MKDYSKVPLNRIANEIILRQGALLGCRYAITTFKMWPATEAIEEIEKHMREQQEIIERLRDHEPRKTIASP
jgi:hypothetical protein